MGCPQQPKGVVLLRREPEPGEQFILNGLQEVVRPPQVEKCFLLRRIEPLPFRPASRSSKSHARIIPVPTTIVQTG